MERIRIMPYEEKYRLVRENTTFTERVVGDFVREKLGNRAFAELYTRWKDSEKTIPREAPLEEQYDIAYSDWIHMGIEDFRFIRKHLGEEGLQQYQQRFVEALKKKNANFSLIMLSLLRLFSPAAAFRMTAREFAYQLQWITPFKVPEINSHGAVFDIMHCKVLDYPDTEDICQIGCQCVYPQWASEQFKVRMQFRPYEHGCIGTLARQN